VLALAAEENRVQQQQQQHLTSSHPFSSSGSAPNQSSQWTALSSISPVELVAAIQHSLFKQTPQQPPGASWFSGVPTSSFMCPAYGRSNLPPNKLIDHPGVWEDARLAYLNEVLVKKRGSPAALSILYCEVMRQLLLLGAVNFTVTFQLR
jgi:hypothetical protein